MAKRTHHRDPDRSDDKSRATIVRVDGRPAAKWDPPVDELRVRVPAGHRRDADRGVGSHVGAAIRMRRKDLGRTMQDVADQAGLSQPFLSQVERGQALPSMRSLDRIAHALDTSGISLLAGASSDQSVDLIRAGERTRIDHGERDSGSAATALTPEHRRLRAIEFAGGWREFQDYHVHRNDEVVVIVAGTYEADVDGERFELVAGDAISYAGGVPHRFRVLGDGPHRFTAVIVPDDFDVAPRRGAEASASGADPGTEGSCNPGRA